MPVKDKYIPHFNEKVEIIGKTNLPNNLQLLIEKFEAANKSFERATENERERFLKILVQSDAVISALLFQLFADKEEEISTDKSKMLAMKAKALKLKMNFNK